ncbi:hypothetical protein GDO81_025389 [Engystomops pustulosus]|uniref:Secreted protein n=1 Tax=Engystomops pustulosus TaxID=76066 RepID=A0AAV6ZNS5_ENGPU|nr:hypothetical protein GDO81_025389 [Engystomops pustulosus]
MIYKIYKWAGQAKFLCCDICFCLSVSCDRSSCTKIRPESAASPFILYSPFKISWRGRNYSNLTLGGQIPRSCDRWGVSSHSNSCCYSAQYFAIDKYFVL